MGKCVDLKDCKMKLFQCTITNHGSSTEMQAEHQKDVNPVDCLTRHTLQDSAGTDRHPVLAGGVLG